MTPQRSTVNDTLAQLLAEQHRYYVQARDLAAALLSAVDRGEQIGVIKEIHALLDHVGEIEQRVRPLREQWKHDGQHLSGMLSDTVVKLEAVLREVIAYIGQAEDKLADAKKRLEPELSRATVHQRMRLAYQSADELTEKL